MTAARVCSLGALFLLLAMPAYTGFGQSSITGTVRDEGTGEAMIGVNVAVVNTAKGAASDIDGQFRIMDLPAGEYQIRCTMIGYSPKTITGVKTRDKETTRLDITLTEEAVSLEEVVITVERQLATEKAMLAVRKNAATIGDGFSSEQVKRSPDATSGDALKRVTGVSIIDNKYVYVRGVTDRYNATSLNGISVTSTDTDSDKKSFSFDMIPANLIENTIVTKTSTPDLPGDFSGGIVQIKTLSFPGRRTLKASLSTGYHGLTTGRTILSSDHGKSDWLGLDDGSRAFPTGAYDKYTLGKMLPNTWQQKSMKAPISPSFSLGYGDEFLFGETQLGVMSALTYRRGFQHSETKFELTEGSIKLLTGGGSVDQASVLWSGLFDAHMKLGGMHKLNWSNNVSQSATDKLSSLRTLDDNASDRKINVSEWEQRTLYVTQVGGEHRLEWLNDMDLSWKGFYSSSISAQPDRKASIYAKHELAPDSVFVLARGDRSWASLREFTRGANFDLTIPVPLAKLKIGASFETKSRGYDIRYYATSLDGNSTAFHLIILPIDRIFNPENSGPGKLVLQSESLPRDQYSASQDLFAGYAMVDLPISILSRKLRLVGGVRMENNDQRVNTTISSTSVEPFTSVIENVDFLPSLNVSYSLNDLSNIRFAYSKSVNRPEFRELASLFFYDFSIYEGTFGNPLLQRALIQSMDFRFELFPTAGELIAASIFYKKIENAIEVRVVPSSNPMRTWFNSPTGHNTGVELEVRKSLNFLGGFFSNVSITDNYTYVNSSIQYTELTKVNQGGGVYVDVAQTREREMQGQAPYMINLSLQAYEPMFETTYSIYLNKFGRRLEAVGDYKQYDIFEESRPVVDLTINQPLWDGFELKFVARDLFPRDRRYTARSGEPHRSIRNGSSYSLQASFSL